MKLFKPFIERFFLKKRVIMGFMGTNLIGAEGFVTDGMVPSDAERAKSGISIIITKLVTVDFPEGKGIKHQFSI
jgi:2,4-dienoyl-CoA reductase-like NADH-dependent reductase (Old Yellow Enzyme family)